MSRDANGNLMVEDGLPAGTVVKIAGISIELKEDSVFIASEADWQLVRDRLHGNGKTARKRSKDGIHF